MYAVFRENTYPIDLNLSEHPNFQEFQHAHADQPGYKGTVIVAIGDGRYLSITLWQTEADMNAAHAPLGPVVERALESLMATPSKLLGTGRVVMNDLVRDLAPVSPKEIRN